MILSRSRGFLFIKTHKTASTSVELALRRFSCGAKDVITPVTPEDEELATSLGLPGPQNCGPVQRIPASELRFRSLIAGVVRRKWPRQGYFYNHIVASEIRRLVPEWDSLLKISIVRNPWDMAVSWYFWDKTYRNTELTLDEAFASAGPWARNWNTISIDDKCVVDAVCRYESLAEDVSAALRLVGIDFDGVLPRAKSRIRRANAPYREVLEARHIDVISDVCRREIELFGYEP